jgi:hypothetical protein
MVPSSMGARALVSLLLLTIGVASGTSFAAEETGSPEDAVRTYISSIKSGDFAKAYSVLTPNMARNQDEAAWVREQTLVMKLADVQIQSFEVFPAKVEGDKAVVPNLLKSKDKFINQTGEPEYELYTVVRGPDKKWKIEQQQLVETDAVAKWFPKQATEKK